MMYVIYNVGSGAISRVYIGTDPAIQCAAGEAYYPPPPPLPGPPDVKGIVGEVEAAPEIQYPPLPDDISDIKHRVDISATGNLLLVERSGWREEQAALDASRQGARQRANAVQAAASEIALAAIEGRTPDIDGLTAVAAYRALKD